MVKEYEKYDFAGKFSRYLKRIESSKWYMSYIQKAILHEIEKKEPEIRNMLSMNKELEKKYQGKRCFVLGNGPSLNNINFKKLCNEIVFTVNQLPEHSNFRDLQSNYHVITDLNAFGLRYNRERLTPNFTSHSLQLMRSLIENGNTMLIVPYQAKNVLKRIGIADHIQVRYICEYREFINGYHCFDLTKPISAFFGVVLTAILCAIYMGISDIYLIGCEQTAIIDTLECILGGQTKYGHAYIGQERFDDEGYRILARSQGIKTLLYGEYGRQEGFEQLYLFARKKGVKIYNLSNPTLIDCIPKRDLKDIGLEK